MRTPVGLMAVALLSLSLRFWHLSRFNDLVFDEVYFVKFAQDYLAGTPTFDAHPPLGKYLIAAGIWVSSYMHWPLSSIEPQMTAAVDLTPLSYRWMNAAFGSCIPLLVFGLAYRLGQYQPPPRRLAFAILSGSFVAIDGLFVTESRYALINTYMVFFGLLGQYAWLQANSFAGKGQHCQERVYRLLSGIALGCAIATKWNGLGFILCLAIYAAAQSKKHISYVVYVFLLPLFVYSLIWLPHLQLTGETLGATHTTLFTFHQQLSTDGHPACAKWYSWPLLIKPITYWYQASETQASTVSNLGNPFLWWLSSASVLLLSTEKIAQLKRRWNLHRWSVKTGSIYSKFNTGLDAKSTALSHYLLIGYAANWLPWMLVRRCTFIYLYMPAAVFSFMTLAWLMSQWLCSPTASIRRMGMVMLLAIAIAFFYWLPLSLGSPLMPESLRMRWWLRTWI